MPVAGWLISCADSQRELLFPQVSCLLWLVIGDDGVGALTNYDETLALGIRSFFLQMGGIVLDIQVRNY